jgi:hypothetical protein
MIFSKLGRVIRLVNQAAHFIKKRSEVARTTGLARVDPIFGASVYIARIGSRVYTYTSIDL